MSGPPKQGKLVTGIREKPLVTIVKSPIKFWTNRVMEKGEEWFA